MNLNFSSKSGSVANASAVSKIEGDWIVVSNKKKRNHKIKGKEPFIYRKDPQHMQQVAHDHNMQCTPSRQSNKGVVIKDPGLSKSKGPKSNSKEGGSAFAFRPVKPHGVIKGGRIVNKVKPHEST